MNKLSFIAAAALALGLSAPLHAATQGTATEAKAMLEKAIGALRADKAKALGEFARGENGFRDRDLYPFCGDAKGTFTAHPTLTGKSMKDLKGTDGEPVGSRLYDAAKEGAINEVEYVWPKPGTTTPAQKVSYVTKIGDQVCAVGFYK